MKKIELEIVGLTHSVSASQNYAIILGEVGSSRRLPVVIGGYEAQAIAVAIENMSPSRPLTHDLIQNIFVALGAELKEILINNLTEGIFYARLICELHGREIEIDSRTSDALALAVRFGCPIYSYDFILDEAAIVLEDEVEREVQDARTRRPRKRNTLEELNEQELQNLLSDALSKEDYEQAAKIRDEIQKRNG